MGHHKSLQDRFIVYRVPTNETSFIAAILVHFNETKASFDINQHGRHGFVISFSPMGMIANQIKTFLVKKGVFQGVPGVPARVPWFTYTPYLLMHLNNHL